MPWMKFVFPIINWILVEITIPGGFLFVFPCDLQIYSVWNLKFKPIIQISVCDARNSLRLLFRQILQDNPVLFFATRRFPVFLSAFYFKPVSARLKTLTAATRKSQVRGCAESRGVLSSQLFLQ